MVVVPVFAFAGISLWHNGCMTLKWSATDSKECKKANFEHYGALEQFFCSDDGSSKKSCSEPLSLEVVWPVSSRSEQNLN
jgi:hypothetical protein